ncbi:MAG TPA: GH116 family glycosyl hydrolase, partial [Luteolibacter sp.]|nr:GH116 family glycosyl hydrolase [Luteolibacter sp.]
TTNTLQTTTCEILVDANSPEGRFWAWEGIGCCPGTCAHVWHYAQGVARLFPSLERNLREVSDFKIGMNPDGSIRFRAESAKTVAIDSQTGIILRTWREHLISNDGTFLKRVWPMAKKALEWLIEFDGKDRDGLDGLIDGEQHNTLDAEWYGKVHCLCSLYLGALRAGEEMARTVKDDAFATRCAEVHRSGAQKIGTLFNGEFYVQQEDPTKLDKIGVGTGCYIDQVIGQWWAHQVGLGRIYDATQIRKALESLWKYNFVPHIGRFREGFIRGRFYAMGDEAGLVMCTWPKGGLRDDFKKHWQYGYFNECMSGFEWQVAAHLIQEGDVIEAKDDAAALLDADDNSKSATLRGLAIGRAIHDRYAPSRRNPYNEIECSDHYARANASYSVFLALCGFHYDGPAGVIGFEPKLSPGCFKAAYTAAEGWGSFEQSQKEGQWSATLSVAHGKLTLNAIRLPWISPESRVTLGGRTLKATCAKGVATFTEPVVISAGDEPLRVSSR